MKKIIILTLLLCCGSNIALASDTYTISNSTQTIPLSYEIAINNLQTKISYYEARRSMLAWLDRVRTPWICTSIALLTGSFVAFHDEKYGLSNFLSSIATFINLNMIALQIIRIYTEKEIPLLQKQIDQLIAKSQQKCISTKEASI